MTKLAAIESENSNGEAASDAQVLKAPSGKRLAASPGVAKTGAAPPPSKKGLVIHNFISLFSYIF
jgi:hypothetical protein